MILDTIILENFGAYCGRQEATLTPRDGKPIVLFGGLNGGGKTTLLDAIQLAFYGAKARISNRGRHAYKDYLRQSIHRGTDPGEGASVVVRFRRMIDGETRHFELSRSWRQGVKGIEETVRVLRDGLPDDVFTDHWDEVIEAYLPSSIAHLFFFDGEQIMELAEGGHAAEILGTAVHSLLGLDLVDRLESDLKVFERRKRAESHDEAAIARLAQARRELEHIDQEQEKAANEAGAMVNVAGRLAKQLSEHEAIFRAEGGDLYQQRGELENKLAELKSRKARLEAEFRELVSGPLPLLLIEPLLAEAEKRVSHEREIRHAKALVEVLEERDAEVLTTLQHSSLQAKAIDTIERILSEDRLKRQGLASEELMLDAPDDLAPHIGHLRGVVLPNAEEQARRFVAELAQLDEHIARVQTDLDRVPPEDRIAVLQSEVEAARRANVQKQAELDSLRFRIQSLAKQRADAEVRLDKMSEQESDAQLATDDRQRMLKHSQKTRDTIDRFRTEIVKRHVSAIESLMLESFQKLLRKTNLITGLTINPETFEATLFGRDGKPLPFDRLSAGERQLLATSMLWGLARASGRPVPMIIDTPLGRLDSDHRKNLVDRYFPNASHQVLLLSTDEEIVDGYFESLRPYVSQTFMLTHDERAGVTNIQEGYFAS
ncbi:MAG: DNA sulfur modification protein DndD [Betaproteobacteria bacterium]|nr:DNA sulfur modification protein DndD [Betaproteobacteria bacterium]